jgi:hypothetical protein
MAEGERIDKRPSCGWPVEQMSDDGKVVGRRPCGSEERVFNVKGHGKNIGRSRETPICEKHLPDAWKTWDVDSAEPLCGDATGSSLRMQTSSGHRL